MKDHLASQVTTICTCWKVTRLDGKVFGFTDHDVDLTIDGLLYNASSGFFRSAITNTATTAADNLEVKGFLDDEQITEEELRNGAFDFATVEIFAVNWMDLSQGIVKLRYGIFGETTQTPIGLFTVELRGLTQLFSQTVGEIFTAACRADLGDSRCKIALIPDERVGNKKYEVGNRVLCRVASATNTRVRLPVQNPKFDELTAETKILAWSVNGMGIDNYNYRNVSSEYWVKPLNTSSGWIRQTIDLNKWFNDTGNTRDTIRIIASLKVHHNSTGWRTRLSLRWNAGEAYSDWSTSASASGGNEVISFDQTIPSTSTFFTVGVISERISTEPPSAEPVIFTAYQSTIHLGAMDVSDSLYWANQNFDTFIGTYGVARSWTFNGPGHGSLGAETTVLSPYTAPFYLNTGYGGLPTTYSQTIPLTVSGVDTAVIDANGYDIELGGMLTALQRGSTRDVVLKFKNASGEVFSTAKLGEKAVTLVRNWQDFKFRTRVPPNARSVEVHLFSGFDAGSNVASTVYDSVYLDIINPAYETTSEYLIYGGIEYACVTAGTTASLLPTFTGILGETVNDGTVVWQAVYPKHTSIYAIATASDHKHFSVSTSLYGESKPTDWFTWGVVEFLTGKNIGRKVEVLSYTHPDFTTALSVPYVPEAGDLIRVHTGCDKMRKTCREKFANVINMRGEPDLPGSGAYFKIGVAK